MTRLTAALVLIAGLVVAGCSPDGGRPTALDDPSLSKGGARGEAPQFMRRDARAPGFRGDVASFRATAGSAASIMVHFADGSPFAAFRVSAETLTGATLHGRPIAEGEAVEITLSQVDPWHFTVELQPAGLRFNPAAPAELIFFYRHANAVRRGSPAVWKQERLDAPWERVGGSDDPDFRTLHAALDGFTRYAVAYGN